MPNQVILRKLADTSEGERVARFDPVTGAKYLANPANPHPETGEPQPEPWPLLGVRIESEVEATCELPMSTVTAGQAEGWLKLEGDRLAYAPAGPPTDPWRERHTFLNCDALTFDTVDGPVRYRVTHQPGKYDDEAEPGGTRVDWFFGLELEDDGRG